MSPDRELAPTGHGPAKIFGTENDLFGSKSKISKSFMLLSKIKEDREMIWTRARPAFFNFLFHPCLAVVALGAPFPLPPNFRSSKGAPIPPISMFHRRGPMAPQQQDSLLCDEPLLPCIAGQRLCIMRAFWPWPVPSWPPLWDHRGCGSGAVCWAGPFG